MSGVPIPAEAKHAFLELLAAGRPVVEICRELGLNRASMYHARRADPEFGRAWDDCRSISMDAVRDEVMRKVLAASGDIVRVPLLHPATGEPVLDDDFEPVMVERLVDYDRELTKALFNKVVQSADGAPVTAVQVNNLVGAELPERPRLVVPEDAIEAEFEELTDD